MVPNQRPLWWPIHGWAGPKPRARIDAAHRALWPASRTQSVTGARAVACAARALIFAAVACQAPVPSGAAPSAQGSAGGEAPTEAPAFQLTADMPNLLLTWIDEVGDFKVAEKRDDIPAANRGQVRVVRTDDRESNPERVVVADLTTPDAQGHFPLRFLPRGQWEELGATRRTQRLESQAPGVRKTSDVEAEVEQALQQQRQDPKPGPAGTIQAVIYGADWCKPCHDAEKFLKGLGLAVTKKDIETSAAARAEMQAKLQKLGRTDGSIPVIDVSGEVFVGFNAAELKKAVARARSRERGPGKSG